MTIAPIEAGTRVGSGTSTVGRALSDVCTSYNYTLSAAEADSITRTST